MFDYKSEALAYSISAENAELREDLLRQELLVTQITMENLKVLTPKIVDAAYRAWCDVYRKEIEVVAVYKAMGNERWVEGKRIAESVIEALRTELAKPEPESVALNWVNLQNAADEIVRNKPTWKRFIDGTPLANDIACWMADFALEYATEPNCKFPHSQEYQDELAKETVPNWSAA